MISHGDNLDRRPARAEIDGEKGVSELARAVAKGGRAPLSEPAEVSGAEAFGAVVLEQHAHVR